MARVTVIIVCWNSSALLGAVLDAIERQTMAPESVLVIDNGSDDAGQLAAIVDSHTRCRLIRLPHNIGFAAANNIGIRQAEGMDFIALLNPDAYPEPQWLAELVAAARAFPEAASFGSRLLNHDDPTRVDGTGDCYSMWGLPWRRGHGRRLRDEDFRGGEIFCPSAAAALYRREALQEVGGFDEDYFCYIEDVDLGFRLRLAGHESRYVPSAVVRHVGSATTGGQHSNFSVYHGHRNLVWTFVKNMPGVLFWLFLPLHLCLNVFTLAWFCMRGRAAIILRAKADALKGLPQAWNKRRRIQAARAASVGAIFSALDKRVVISKKDR